MNDEKKADSSAENSYNDDYVPAKKVYSTRGFILAVVIFFIAVIVVTIFQIKRQNNKSAAPIEVKEDSLR